MRSNTFANFKEIQQHEQYTPFLEKLLTYLEQSDINKAVDATNILLKFVNTKSYEKIYPYIIDYYFENTHLYTIDPRYFEMISKTIFEFEKFIKTLPHKREFLTKAKEVKTKILNTVYTFICKHFTLEVQNYSLAIECCNILIAISENLDGAYTALGFMHLHSNNPIASIEANKKAVFLAKNLDMKFDIYHNCGLAYKALSQFQDAVEMFELASRIKAYDLDNIIELMTSYEALDADHTVYKTLTSRLRGHLKTIMLFHSEIRFSNVDSLKNLKNEIIEFKNLNVEKLEPRLLTSLLYAEARVCFELGEYERTSEIFEGAVNSCKFSIMHYAEEYCFLINYNSLITKQFEKAKRYIDYLKSNLREKYYFQATLLIAEILYYKELGDFDEVVRLMKTIIDLANSEYNTRMFTLVRNLAKDCPKVALETVEYMQKLYPQNLQADLCLAFSHYCLDNYSQAKECILKTLNKVNTLSRADQYHTYTLFVSLCYVDSGLETKTDEIYEILKYLDKALAIDPNNDELYLQKGISQIFLGNKEEANESFKIAIDLNPLNKIEIDSFLINVAESLEFQKINTSTTSAPNNIEEVKIITSLAIANEEKKETKQNIELEESGSEELEEELILGLENIDFKKVNEYFQTYKKNLKTEIAQDTFCKITKWEIPIGAEESISINSKSKNVYPIYHRDKVIMYATIHPKLESKISSTQLEFFAGALESSRFAREIKQDGIKIIKNCIIELKSIKAGDTRLYTTNKGIIRSISGENIPLVCLDKVANHKHIKHSVNQNRINTGIGIA